MTVMKATLLRARIETVAMKFKKIKEDVGTARKAVAMPGRSRDLVVTCRTEGTKVALSF